MSAWFLQLKSTKSAVSVHLDLASTNISTKRRMLPY